MLPASFRLRHLYISSGHNFFGHNDRPPSTHAMEERSEIHCLAGRGIEGDRFLDYKSGYKGQITFFAWETFQRLQTRFRVLDCSPAVFRRNVVTEGIDLPSLVGQEFAIQGIRFEGTGEARPCYWMDKAFAPGAEEAMRGHGGLRARILDDGTLRRDD